MEVRAHGRPGMISSKTTTTATHEQRAHAERAHGSVGRVRAASHGTRGATTVASSRSADDSGEVGRAQFDDGVGVASFRGFKVVNELEIELEVGAGEATSDGCPAPRGSGAGRVGMAGFDSYPGFASFTWMSEDEFEIYEDGHSHEHEHGDGGHGHAHGATSAAAKGVDTETKALYAGIATASALIAAKTAGVLPKLPEIPMSFTSLISKQSVDSPTAKKQKKKDTSSTKSKTLTNKAPSPPTTTDFGITEKNIKQVAGAALASTVGIATLVGLSGSTSKRTRRRMSAGDEYDYGMRSLQRLEELREAMLIEFVEEQRQLGLVKQGKSDKMKGLDEKFQSTLREVKQSVIKQEVTMNGIQQKSAEEQQRALAMLMKDHEVAMKALADAFDKQESELKAKIARLEAALKETETALAAVKEAMQNMESRHETELRAARGLIRAERELGQSEAAKYRAARDLQNSHVNALKADLALAQLSSSEKFAFLEQQLKDICGSYSARILKEREVAASALEKAREDATEEQIRMLTAFAEENRSTPRADLIAAVAELRAQAEVEKRAIAATYEAALRGAAGERRALKALYESELQKASNNGSSVSAEISQLKSQLAAAEVSSSQRLNEEIRKAQVDFEQRVMTLKKTHMAELEQAQRRSSTAGGGDAATNALSESHRIALNAMQKAHADAMQAALAKADKRVADAEALLRERIANMKATSDAEKAQLLAKLGAERQAIMSEVKGEQSASAAEVESLKQEYENLLVQAVAQVQSLASADADKLKQALKASTGERRALYAMMHTEARKKSAASKVDFASEVVATEARVVAYWEQKIKDAEAAKDAQMRQLMKSYESKISEARSTGESGDDLIKVVAALKKELEDQRAQAEQTLVAAVAEIQASAAADKAAVTALVRTETEDAFKAEKEAIMKAHALEIEAMQNAAKTKLSGEEAMKMKQVEDLVKAKLAEAEIAARNVSQNSTSSAQSAVTELEKRLIEVQKEHEAKITELNRANKVAAMRSEDDLRKQLAAAKKDLDKFNSESKSSKRTRTESITYTFKGNDTELKLIRKERDSLQDKVRRMEEEYSKKLASANASDAVTALQAELEKARAEREQDVQAMVKRVEVEKAEIERALRAELAAAKSAMASAESQYGAAMSNASSASSSERGFWSSMFKGNTIDARIEEQSTLRAAAESEVKAARAREVELNQRVAVLTAEIQGASSQAAKDVAALKDKLDKAMDEASKNLASATNDVVQKYEARIRELEASSDKTINVVAKLQAEAEMQLTTTVAKLMTEREQAIASAQQKFATELAQVKSDAESSEAEKLAEASAMQAKMVTAQQDVITWKDQAASYKTELTKLQTERMELLTKLKNSQDALTNNIAQSVKESKARDDEIVRAVAKSMADATVEFNAKLQVSQQQAKEAESKLLNLRSVFETRAREVAQQTTKELKEREVTLEKKLRQAQRDYAQQGKVVESLEHRLSTAKSQMEVAEKKWNRLQREMIEEFEQRLAKEKVPLAEKIAFYEQRVETLKQEVKAAQKSRGLFGSKAASTDPNAPAPVIVKRAFFEFNRDKLQAEAEAREEAERALTAATEEMQALKLKLEAAQAEVEQAKEMARLEAEKNSTVSVSPFAAIFARMFGTPTTSKSAVEEKKQAPAPAVVSDLTTAQALQVELDATRKTLADLKATYAAEVTSTEAAVRKEYESKLASLKSAVSELESQLASANKAADAKLAASMKAAEQERASMEKSLRSEIAAAKQLAASAKIAAEREYQTALREANAKAKRELEKQARDAAAARAESEKRLRESAKKAIDKLKAEIADFDARLDARDEDIERKFNAQFDKLVADFRYEVEKLQRRAKDAEAIAKGEVGEEIFAATSAKIDNLRAKYERELENTIMAKDDALRKSRGDAAKSLASDKTKAQEQLEKQFAERERQIKLDRQKLERSFEKTEAKDAEIAALKQSLDQAEQKLREFKELSDRESIALERSKREVAALKSGASKTIVEVTDDVTISSTTIVTKSTQTSEQKTGVFTRLFETSSSKKTEKK